MTDEVAPRRPGRPQGTGPGPTKLRHIRVGGLWEQCGEVLAPGETMTDFVKEAMRREMARRERQQKS